MIRSNIASRLGSWCEKNTARKNCCNSIRSESIRSMFVPSACETRLYSDFLGSFFKDQMYFTSNYFFANARFPSAKRRRSRCKAGEARTTFDVSALTRSVCTKRCVADAIESEPLFKYNGYYKPGILPCFLYSRQSNFWMSHNIRADLPHLSAKWNYNDCSSSSKSMTVRVQSREILEANMFPTHTVYIQTAKTFHVY